MLTPLPKKKVLDENETRDLLALMERLTDATDPRK